MVSCSCCCLAYTCCAGRVVQQVLAKLVHLRELKLAVVCPTPHLASADLVALTACSALTALHAENFTLVPGVLDSTAAAATSAAGGVQLLAGQAAAPCCSQTATAQAVAGPQGQLKTLRSLSLGDMGTVIFHAPVTAFAPQLTALREVGVQLALAVCSTQIICCADACCSRGGTMKQAPCRELLAERPNGGMVLRRQEGVPPLAAGSRWGPRHVTHYGGLHSA